MANNPSTENIFCRPLGRPYKFFVEAAAVRGRPAFVRKIQSLGGEIVSNPKESDILLAESGTREAIELLDAWSGDKVMLTTRWINQCIESKKFLGPDSNWGNCLLDKDSLIQALDEEANGILLFDARHTPATVNSSTSQGCYSRRRRSSPSTWEVSPSKRSKVSNQPRVEDSLMPPPPPFPPPTPQVGNSLIPTFPTSGLSPQLMYPSPSQSSYQPHTLPVPPSTYAPILLPQIAGPSSQPQQQQHLDIFSYFNPQLNMLPLLALGQLSSNPQQLATQLREAADRLSGQVSSLPSSSQVEPTYGPHHIARQRSSPIPDYDRISEPSESEVESSVVCSVKRKTPNRRTYPSEERKSDSELLDKHSAEVTAPEYKQGIFANNGKSMSFYIMIDVQQRKELLQMVKKHGGKIVLKMDDADHIILNNRSNLFQSTHELMPASKIAVSRRWLKECCDQDVLIPKTPYVLDAASGAGRGLPRRRGKQSLTKAKVVKGSEEGGEYESEEVDSVDITSTPISALSQTQRPGRHSPSPPKPPPVYRGKYPSFTDADREWFFQYARTKFQETPEISWSSLVKMVARKAPYHNATSWHHTARTKWRDQYEQLCQEQSQYFTRLYPSGSGTLQTQAAPQPTYPPESTQQHITKQTASQPTESTQQHIANTNIQVAKVKNDPEQDNIRLDQL